MKLVKQTSQKPKRPWEITVTAAAFVIIGILFLVANIVWKDADSLVLTAKCVMCVLMILTGVGLFCNLKSAWFSVIVLCSLGLLIQIITFETMTDPENGLLFRSLILAGCICFMLYTTSMEYLKLNVKNKRKYLGLALVIALIMLFALVWIGVIRF